MITHPCRFGKTLNMSMLASFFDIRKNSSALFEGLEMADMINGRSDDTMLKTGLALLMRMMQAHYGKPVI